MFIFAGNHALEQPEPVAFADVEGSEVRIYHHRTVFVSPGNWRLLGLRKFRKHTTFCSLSYHSKHLLTKLKLAHVFLPGFIWIIGGRTYVEKCTTIVSMADTFRWRDVRCFEQIPRTRDIKICPGIDEHARCGSQSKLLSNICNAGFRQSGIQIH